MERKYWERILVTDEDKKKILKVKEFAEKYGTLFNHGSGEDKRRSGDG